MDEPSTREVVVFTKSPSHYSEHQRVRRGADPVDRSVGRKILQSRRETRGRRGARGLSTGEGHRRVRIAADLHVTSKATRRRQRETSRPHRRRDHCLEKSDRGMSSEIEGEPKVPIDTLQEEDCQGARAYASTRAYIADIGVR